ncbi:protein 60A [Bactrocera neohumeralis]|uniref:protein 60A n=1 Tax=Bactrocera tryoni TaxID=59916 RepID=UPI001A981E8E|nr:protein 60A [Bactrocera tryoni]XP_039959234.1 protein 60A [Bactrocera tryoni]XP_050329543.1 protein 60A [Bactrocera neohumeralis]XP_050329544.1 protein 60A [Bactrocera neohumeralis]XP_050329545.1 protein 60A [Bactrocera neohumeralis]
MPADKSMRQRLRCATTTTTTRSRNATCLHPFEALHRLFCSLLLMPLLVLLLLSQLSIDIDNSLLSGRGGLRMLVAASQSGIYIDNGVDQTIMHRALDEDDKMNVSYEILEFLGLAERPRRKHGHLSLRKSAPQFLLDVYHRLTEEENSEAPSRAKRDLEEQENFITDLDKQAIDQSDIIMTFLNKNHHVDEVRHEHGRRLWFDVSDVPNDNYLMMAELRIYQNPAQGKWLTSGREFTISVYSIVNMEGQRELEVLSSVNTTSDYQGWLELNVTQGLDIWLHDHKSNKGLYIGAHAVNKPEREVKLDDIGLVHPKGDDEYQPFMIGFFRGPELIKSTNHHSRKKRNTPHVRRRKKSEMINPFLDGTVENMRSCQIQTLYIDFKDLGWNDWIIAPEGYGAFYCSGECNFPLNAHMNATNHAIVQTLVHLLEPKKVPKPCCAPTRLGALPVLYHLNEENVNLKKYKNMIVKSCGCH